MINLTKVIFTSLLLGLVFGDSPPFIVSGYNSGCAVDFSSTCDLQCPNGNYVLDTNGCPTCACAIECQEMKCRANCGEAGYVLDENGCQTCKCKVKENVQCSRFMCRMFCQYGFKRDENGCEYCACNEAPQQCPLLNCQSSCTNGYRKDYSGCQTCECIDEEIKDNTIGQCPPFTCELNCKYGYQRDESGCNLCLCNSCPMRTCRMYCMYGFKKNEVDGCDMCECDWTPVAEKIQCDERIPCPSTRVCNLNLRLCEAVKPDDVNWFTYDFEVESDLFSDEQFIQTFKNGLIHNIAAKYNLQTTQISVSSVEHNGLTSFQIMPFFNEDRAVFDSKMDRIDNELNSNEFRSVMPAVARAIDDGEIKNPNNIRTWCQKFRSLLRTKFVMFAVVFLLTSAVLIFLIGYISVRRRYMKVPNRSESKAAIYDDASYHLGSTDEDYQAVIAPDGTKYIVVSTDDTNASKGQQVNV